MEQDVTQARPTVTDELKARIETLSRDSKRLAGEYEDYSLRAEATRVLREHVERLKAEYEAIIDDIKEV